MLMRLHHVIFYDMVDQIAASSGAGTAAVVFLFASLDDKEGESNYWGPEENVL